MTKNVKDPTTAKKRIRKFDEMPQARPIRRHRKSLTTKSKSPRREASPGKAVAR
jgi:hypothetical protein